ncbi:MAG: RluA family pseudouridine synthase [Provencibacterium sp.]|jgi:23S rRNA pseudouridine1911/1915/1917 synthase|nr:RluA family pseudouridine synthase [Provencibacterium sp.]
MDKEQYRAGPEQEGARLDSALAALCSAARTEVQRWIEAGAVCLNGRPARSSARLREGDILSLIRPEPVEWRVQAQQLPLHIIYEDAALLVVNKPKGMVVHPAPGNPDGTLVNALLWHCRGELSGIGGVLRPGIVHRIDKDTSGLLAVAKTDAAHRSLAEQIAAHRFLREYRAVVYGALKEQEGTVNAPIGRHPADRKRMAVNEKNGKPACTHYRLVEPLDGFSHIACRLETGRTHQIRVHMASIGHPVAGDPVYGPKRVITSLQGQCLHAKTLGFLHPLSGEMLRFDCPLPEYFTEFLRKNSL